METNVKERRAKLEKELTPEQKRRIALRKSALTIRAQLAPFAEKPFGPLGSEGTIPQGPILDARMLADMTGRLPWKFRKATSSRVILGPLAPLVLHEPFRTARESERPPAEQAQHGVFTFEVTERDSTGNPTASRVRNLTPLSIDWYFRKGTIDKQMQEAGHKIGQLFFEAGKVPRTNVMWRERVQKSLKVSDFGSNAAAYSDAETALNEALRVLMPLEVDVLRDVAGLNLRAGSPGRVRLLQLGLRALAVHFGITLDVGRPKKEFRIPKPKKVP